jgi:hypothetical protein
MPCWNWFKVHEEGNFNYLYKLDNYKIIPKYATSDTIEKWHNLYQQYIDDIGVNDNYIDYLRLVKRLVIAKCDYAITKDRFLLNEIRMLETDIEETKTDGKPVTFGETTAVLSKYLGFRLDVKQISVLEYYNYINLMKRDNGKANNK